MIPPPYPSRKKREVAKAWPRALAISSPVTTTAGCPVGAESQPGGPPDWPGHRSPDWAGRGETGRRGESSSHRARSCAIRSTRRRVGRFCSWSVRARTGRFLQREPDVPGEHGAAGELGAVASCSDDGGPDGFLPQNVVPLAQGAAPDGPAQEHADVPVGKGIGRRLPDQIRHTAGKGQGDLPRRQGGFDDWSGDWGNLSLPQASRHLQSLDQALYSRGQVRFRHPLARSQMA